MTTVPDANRIFQAMDMTWPAAETLALGPWILRRGKNGGKRVSAATTNAHVTGKDIQDAKSAMVAMGQVPLFMLRQGNADLDIMLDAIGYRVVDPVLLMAAPCDLIAQLKPALLAAIPAEFPLAMMQEIWMRGGIGPARINVMLRAKGPKTFLFSRHEVDKPAGCAFVAVDGDIAMLHALEVAPKARRSGVGRNLLGRAAIWSKQHGATYFAVATTGENLPAQKLFSGLGMQVVDKYHYRMK